MPDEGDRYENQQPRYELSTPDPMTEGDVSWTPTATATINTPTGNFCLPYIASLTRQLSIAAPDTSSGTIIGMELMETLGNCTPNDTPKLNPTESAIIGNNYGHAVPLPMNVSEQGRGFIRPEERSTKYMKASDNGLRCNSSMEGSMRNCKWKEQLFPQGNILRCAENILNY